LSEESKLSARSKEDPKASFPFDAQGDITAYRELIEELKARIKDARVSARIAVNRELVLLYWHIGRRILAKQEKLGWGAKVIDRLSEDLRREFPEGSGFSSRNLKYMRKFAAAFPEEPFVQQAAAQIPWGHHMALLDKVKGPTEHVWYLTQTIHHGWSRAVLLHQVESDLFSRQGQAITNFDLTLPSPQSDLAKDLLKDPYHLDFLDLSSAARERDFEQALLVHVRDFLLELGVGFALVGSQHRLEVGGREYRLDLLFYHLRLRCLIAVDLKIGPFKPEHAGKMNFYLAAMDDLLRREEDHPSIGLILCKDRNKVAVEYALRGSAQPIGVAEYQLTKRLPEELRGSLPTPEELRRGLEEGG
jgi:predicted nuclease of restriction endonuclease-like (RecB) superfamily